ncbi:MAG TPA: hypothetical protein VK153_00605 [Candidatus Paceibacterota bacterium]|nr:hypothetical protein [Candidatus Paceibacterota bacterium]
MENFNLDFNTKEKSPVMDEAYEKEQMEVARKNNILNHKELTKKEDGKWYIYGMKVEDYIESMSGKDSDDLYRR